MRLGGLLSRYLRLELRTATDDARVSSFELFFDLVFVFGFTQVGRLMVADPSGASVLRALVVLGLLWWTWCAFAWLGNHAPADQRPVRLGLALATVVVFLVTLAVPAAYGDGDGADGGRSGALVVVGGYAAVRLVHLGVYLVAAGRDAGLRVQLLRTQLAALAPAAAALLAGALLGAPAQTPVWTAAVAWDVVVTGLTSRGGGGWRLHSPAHWAERHGLVVILALGESVVAVGSGIADHPLDGPVALSAVLAVALSVALWWAYFDSLSTLGEEGLRTRTGGARVVLARDAYTYAHLPLVAGVILVAAGTEVATEHLAEHAAAGWFAAATLAGGTALYLAGTVVFAALVDGRVRWVRVGGAAVALATVPGMAALVAPAAVSVALAVLCGTLVVEAAVTRSREG